MATVKKGFIVYFNNYPLISTLPMEQRGLLFSILMVYADRVWREPSATLEEVLEGFPALSAEARMACGFMGNGIQRDTEAWLNKQGYWIKKREEGAKQKTAQKAQQQVKSDQRIREDMERARRLLEQMPD